MFSKKTIMVIGIIFLITINIIFLVISGSHLRDENYTDRAEPIAFTLVAPFQEVVTYSLLFLRDIWEHYFSLVSIAKKNDILQKKLSIAIEKDNLHKEILLANIRLRNLLNFKNRIKADILVAEVIGKDPSTWFKSITINKGSAEGIKKGMPVIVPEGIAGLVTDVSYHYSKVILIIDQNSAIDALIQESRARGIVKGKPPDQCVFKYILQKYDIEKGDTIISSGLDGIFPKGLRIGEVSTVTKNNAGIIFQEIIITPYVDFEKLEEVLIILKNKNEK